MKSSKQLETELWRAKLTEASSIEDRFCLVLESLYTGRGFWESLEIQTKISSQSWRSAFNKRQRPTLEMVEALSRISPGQVFWMATGTIPNASLAHEEPKQPN